MKNENRKVSIVIPYIRPEGMQRCKDVIFRNAGIPRKQFELLTSEDKERIGAPIMIQLLVKVTKHDLVMFLGDDTVPWPDFLKNALITMDSLPDGWGVVGLNDGVHDGNFLATHWLADKRMLPLLGGDFFHTGYWHCFCDNELTQRATELGRYVWAADAKVSHENPLIRTELPMTEDYQRVYSSEWYYHDQVLFWQRRQNGWQTN